jgi:hypothetical protein
MARYTRAEIIRACRTYGSQIEGLPEGIDGAQLLWAISGNESSFGANARAMYEPAYGPNGRYAHPQNWAKYGKPSASSLGPWQLMYVNAPPGYTPADIQDDLDTAAKVSVWFMNKQIARFKPMNLATIGSIWNGGNPHAWKHEPVQVYIKKLERNYQVPMEAMEVA